MPFGELVVALVDEPVVEVGAVVRWLISIPGVLVAVTGLEAVPSVFEALPALVGLESSSDKPWLAADVLSVGLIDELSQIAGLPPLVLEFIELGVEAGCAEMVARAVVGSSLKSGSCGFTTGDCSEAVACGSGLSIVSGCKAELVLSLDAPKLSPIGPDGMSEAASSLVFSLATSVAFPW